jgi:hypothetical protein
MSTEAKYEVAGHEKSDGLNVLDIVRHAVKMVVSSLGPRDRLAIVSFDDSAETVFPLAYMDEEGHVEAFASLELLRPRGATNLWAGLHSGLESLRSGGEEARGRNRTIMLLTDGQPNTVPDRGHIHAIRMYKDQHPKFHFQVSTFGFGYALDSELLGSIACECGGSFAFVPDSPILGTVFIHALANSLSTHSQTATLTLTASHGATIAGPVGSCLPCIQVPWGLSVQVGPLQFGQSREVTLPLTLPDHAPTSGDTFLEAYLELPGRKRVTALHKPTSEDEALACEVAYLRSLVVQTCSQVLSSTQDRSADMMRPVAERIASSFAITHPAVIALHNDVLGRLSKSLTGMDRYNRWGKHYVRALMRALQLQQCTNFKDSSVQVFGGAIFGQLRSQGDSLFLAIPPPKSQLPQCPICSREFPKERIERHVERCMAGYEDDGSEPPPPPPAAEVDMSSYNNSGGGCFGPTSTVEVLLPGGRTVARTPVAKVKAGDTVRVATKKGWACVQCVVSMPPKPLFAVSGGLTATGSHPIRLGGVWKKPSQVGLPAGCAPVYNFVLDSEHLLLVDGVECVTFGHGLMEEGVAHPFYGSHRVIQALQSLPGWQSGLVCVAHCLRNNQGKVFGFSSK